HPLFVEGLHALAPLSDALRHWHDSVAAATPTAAPANAAALGNVAISLILRADPNWVGEIDLCTDALGRVGFPFCDWTLALQSDADDLLANRVIRLALGTTDAVWRLADSDEPPVLVTSRADCVRMLVGNVDPVDRDRLRIATGHIRPRLQQAGHFGRSPIRYDPVAFRDGHAGLTGGVVGRVISAVRRNSPAVYRELARLIHTVRGFEFPGSAAGTGASFSDPTLPGVIGVGLSYTPRDQPCLDPFCFTWFGHELGHTKDYLCDSVLYGCGRPLVLNPADMTDPIPRYGRPLAVRTLFQVPYVHLYEWALLMDFWEAGFRGLPWPAPAGAAAVGDDVAAEIKEAFALIRDRAKLTPLGETALRHFKDLYALALARWRFVRSHGGQ
ncbi:MAG TPA: hypothetical protein VH120_15120, partial [Gemmataceae bacterium]|nr:hypothetical protein [Gemmataceae bacterium]